MHHATLPDSPSPTPAAPAEPAAPRFANDWVSVWLQLDHGTGLLHVGTESRRWVLEPAAPEKLQAALSDGQPVHGEFNPGLRIALVPGAHKVAGSSFFRLRR